MSSYYKVKKTKTKTKSQKIFEQVTIYLWNREDLLYLKVNDKYQED
jgi:hypothetical protein